MHVPAELKDRVTKELERCILVCENAFKRKFEIPNVVYNIHSGTAGTAHAHRNEIAINPTLLVQNPEEMVNVTVPHEFAHIVDKIVYSQIHDSRRARFAKRSVHGPTWKRIMNLLGADSSRCHQMDVSSLKTRRTHRFKYKCACNVEHQIGPKHHKSVMRGGMLTIRKCRHTLTIENWVDRPKPLQHVSLATLLKSGPVVIQMLAIAPQQPVTKKLSTYEHVKNFVKHQDRGSADMIKAIMQNWCMSKAGASTYYYKAKSELEGRKHAG